MSKPNLDNPMESLDIRWDEPAKHTPGPWGIEDGYEPGDWAIHNHEGIQIAEVYQEPKDRKRAKYNALLLAAAPDLLDACLKYVGQFYGEPIEEAELQAIMKDAIARAEGRHE